MDKLFLLDGCNYDPRMPELRREAVRAVILRGSRLLMVQTDRGEVKFPGGGVEKGESDLEALCREVTEETGYHVLPHTIRPWGEAEEKRLSRHEDLIWHHFSRYYFCQVDDAPEACRYTANEKRYQMHCIWCTLDEALALNRAMLDREGEKPWNQREYKALTLLKESLAS